MSHRMPDPAVMGFQAFANIIAAEHTDDEVQNPPAEKQWKEWALRVRDAPGFVDAPVPDPVFFADWRTWALTWKMET